MQKVIRPAAPEPYRLEMWINTEEKLLMFQSAKPGQGWSKKMFTNENQMRKTLLEYCNNGYRVG